MILLSVIAIMYVALFLSILRTQKQTPLGVFDYEFAIRYVDFLFPTDFERCGEIMNYSVVICIYSLHRFGFFLGCLDYFGDFGNFGRI